MKRTSLLGRRIGRLTVIKTDGPNHCLCRCDCGKEIRVWKANLYRDNTRSCGCLSAERQSRSSGLSTKHSAEHSSWVLMLRRCYNEENKSYPDYGGRGITVCERWRNSFRAFIKDVGPRPSKDHSIDRFPNNDGDYEPGNVRWATRVEQQNNTRKNDYITHNGVTKTLTQWSEQSGLAHMTLFNRIHQLGWSIERALTAKPQQRGRTCSLSGCTRRHSGHGLCGLHLAEKRRREAGMKPRKSAHAAPAGVA